MIKKNCTHKKRRGFCSNCIEHCHYFNESVSRCQKRTERYHWHFCSDITKPKKKQMKDWQNGINIPNMFVAIFVICFIRLISCVRHFRIKNGTISIQFKTKDDSTQRKHTTVLSIYSNRSDKILIRDVLKLICVCPFGTIYSQLIALCVLEYSVIVCFEYQFENVQYHLSNGACCFQPANPFIL